MAWSGWTFDTTEGCLPSPTPEGRTAPKCVASNEANTTSTNPFATPDRRSVSDLTTTITTTTPILNPPKDLTYSRSNNGGIMAVGKQLTNTSFCDLNNDTDDHQAADKRKKALQETRGRLMEIYAVHRLLLTYLGVPVAISTLTLLIGSILSVFYLFLVADLPWMMTFTYAILRFLPIIILPNIPVILQIQVLNVTNLEPEMRGGGGGACGGMDV
ncbi:hypothetical protein Pcinc_019987 [Petrolisthes cinctipes]|uniref:Transmembrane protein n=1 Tax=Petrolisthes cinctipes TaxID=88211 RepID=A0AAE1KKE0_PETCI|nr:hypothetical protein Pcinc_019987 [Petrolisthes cinctipes]